MGEQCSTTSTIIYFAENLEEQSSIFYEELAKKFANKKDTFMSFAKESRTNKISIIRTYQETVTDAFETGFSFENLNLSEFNIDIKITKNDNLSDMLRKAIELEEKMIKFYTVVAEKSKTLLGAISTDLSRIAEKRYKRKLKLEEILKNID